MEGEGEEIKSKQACKRERTLTFSFSFQDIQKSTEKQQNLKSQQSEFFSELNKLSDKAKLNGSSINAYQSDIESFQV